MNADIAVEEILDKYSDDLSEQQLRALPLLAFGMRVPRVAKSLGISEESVRQWTRTDNSFRSALSEFKEQIKYFHLAMLNQAGVLAWDRAFEYLGTDYDKDDKTNRNIQSKMAQFVIGQLNVMGKDLRDEDPEPQVHITEDSADIIARKVHELQNKDKDTIVVDYDVQDTFDDDDPRVAYNKTSDIKDRPDFGKEFEAAERKPIYPKHPSTEYGELTFSSDKKKVKCHICGEWQSDLVVHIRGEHGISPARYREMYYIPKKEPLGTFKPIRADEKDIVEYNESTILDEEETDSSSED